MEAKGTLMQRTEELLADAQEPLMDISRATGISLYWLQDFRKGRTEHPSVNRVQDLYEYLTSKKLKV